MKRFFWPAVIVGVIILSGLGYWLLSPFWRSVTVNEALPTSVLPTVTSTQAIAQTSTTEEIAPAPAEPVGPQTLYVGVFTGFDSVHHGTGTVKIIEVDGKNYVHFEEDFIVANGPDLFVGFGKDGKYLSGSEISRLKGDKGSQNYELDTPVDLADANEVWIWCRAFREPFARAVLQ